MPYLSVVNGIPTMKEGGIPASIAPRAPAPIEYARPDDRIVLRPGQPPMVIKAEELELEVREIEIEDHTPNIYAKTPEGSIAEEFADAMIRVDEDASINKSEVYEEFKKWYIINHGKNIPKKDILFDYMTKRFGPIAKKGWFGCKILYDDDDDDEEKVIIPEEFVYNDCVEYDSQKIYRHPIFREYGCDFETGEVFHFKPKRNDVNNRLTVNLKNGITLSLGQDSDGNRVQKHYLPHKFVGETALHYKKIKQSSAFHTKLMINTKCDAYIKRPHIKLYPLGCLVYTADGTPDGRSSTNPMNTLTSSGEKGIIDGAGLRDRVKTADQIDAFMGQIRRENEKLKNKIEARDAEVAKLKEQIQKQNDENNKLKDDIENLSRHSNSPLKAGAIQLQELLMTEHQGSTFWEMLQFCVKDITRDYPKNADDEYERSDYGADFGIFEMSPRGLPRPDENYIRQID